MTTIQLLEKGEYVGSIIRECRGELLLASISRYSEEEFYNEWHCHTNAHVSFVLCGGCAEIKKQSYERLPGRTTFYRTGEAHRIISIRNSLHINLEIDRVFFEEQALTENDFAAMETRTPDLNFLMLSIYKELLANDALTAGSIRMLLSGFLEKASQWDNHKKPLWLKTVHEVLHDRWDETPSLEDLAEATSIHPRTISYYFPRYFACTLGAYMRKLKIAKSLTLIKQPGKSLTGIAYECGFTDQSHFIRTFKDITGLLPKEYKANYYM